MQNMNANFMGLGWGDFDLFDLEFLTGSPANCGLAVNSLSCSLRHGGCSSDKESDVESVRRRQWQHAVTIYGSVIDYRRRFY
jgi:hypothetical protein